MARSLLSIAITLVILISPARTERAQVNANEEEIIYTQDIDTLSIVQNYIQDRKWRTVSVTVYNPVKEQCDADYWITASGAIIDTLNPLKHRWIAVSRDLYLRYGLQWGQKIFIVGTGVYDGVWEVQDLMNRRWKNRIDLLVGLDDPIIAWTKGYRKPKITKIN